jgi:1,4-dihydroxy-6-naphthoate synthase
MHPVFQMGISPCPNDVFLYAGLILGRVPTPGWTIRFAYEDIETLNEWSRNGMVDAVKISYAQLPKIASKYRLLRCGGALGRGCGPLLLTGGEDFASQREILIPGENTTANALLDFFLRREMPDSKPSKRFQRFDDLYRALLTDRTVQGVVIHEMRFTYAADGLRLVQDLGAYWENQMHAPIPLGALVLRRDCPITPAQCEDWVRQSLLWSRQNEAEALDLCRHHSQSMDASVMRQHIDLYVNGYSLDLGVDGEEAVALFLRHLGFQGEVFG